MSVAQQIDVPGVDVDPSALDPATVAGIAVGLVAATAVLYGLWRLVRWLRRPAGVRFREALASVDAVTVLTHPNPDPDAMSSAIAVARLAAHAGTDATVQYPGRIQHQENRAFHTVLDLDLERIESIEDVADGEVVLVDHNRPRGFLGAEGVDPYAVVDHHPGDGQGTAFTDVRADYGACATMVAEYFRSLDATVDPEEVPEDDLALDETLATGLMYGVQSDTNKLTKGCSSAEFRACEYLYPAVDDELLNRIANPQVDAEVLDAQARAITNRTIDPPYAVSDVGEVTNADAIPQAADELVRLEGVTAVVVYGDVAGEIHLSGRSRDDRVHMGNVLQAAVEDIPMAGAGGHARMGGGQISREHMEGLGPQKGITITDLEGRLFDAMRGDIQ